MKKFVFVFSVIAFTSFTSGAQTGYDIRVDLKGCKDTMAFLLKYTFDQTYLVDTCKKIKNGQIIFKGKGDLDKGVYILVNQDKMPYFELLINESQRFSISADAADISSSLRVTGSKENDLFFSHIKYSAGKNKEFNEARQLTAGKSKQDSIEFMNEKIAQLNADVKKFEADFQTQIKGTYIGDVFNLKIEKLATNVPKASNGRPDSVYQYYYYKNHYFDGVDFKDDKILRTPYFDDRVKKYFDNVILMHPDTFIVEIDKILAKCNEGSIIYRALAGYFIYTAEQSKIVTFDKVFVHMADNYIINGKAKGIYDEQVVKNISKRVDIMRNLLVGNKVSDLYMIDTADGRFVRKMGFDTVTSAQSITNLYYQNEKKLVPLFKTLYQVNAKYTILIFWAADCNHCQVEVPKLHEELKELNGKTDIKVFAVQTRDDLFDSWKKFIVQNKLTDFTHVFDPVHINDVKTKFDVNSTPMVYILDRDKKILMKKMKTEQVIDLIMGLEFIDKGNKK